MKRILSYLSFAPLVVGLILVIGGVAGDLLTGKELSIGVRQVGLLIAGGVLFLVGMVLTIVFQKTREIMTRAMSWLWRILSKVACWVKVNLFMHTNRLMVLVVLVYGVLYFFWGELIPAEDGFGFDGVIFRQMVKEFPTFLIDQVMREYYVGRVLPSLIVHYALLLFNLPLEDLYILKGFQLLNLVVITFSAVLWGKIADHLSLSKAGKWLGFIGLFINYGIGKYDFYYIPLTDQMAFFLGVLLLFFFLKRKPFGILVTSILGAFTMNSILYIGLLLFVFSGEAQADGVALPARKNLNLWITGLYCTALLVVLVLGNFVYEVYTLLPREPVFAYIYLSIILAVAFHFYAYKEMLNNANLFSLKYLFNPLRSRAWWFRLVVAVVIYLVCSLVYKLFGTENEFLFSTVGIFQRSLQMSIMLPAVFFLGFVIWYGPIAFLTLFWWKRVTAIIHSYGLGLILFMMLNLFFGLSADPRYILGAFPFFVAFTVKAGEGLGLKSRFYWFVAVLAFLASKIWLWFNKAVPWTDYYVMNWAAWFSDKAYVIQGVIALVMAGTLFAYLQWSQLSAPREQITRSED